MTLTTRLLSLLGFVRPSNPGPGIAIYGSRLFLHANVMGQHNYVCLYYKNHNPRFVPKESVWFRYAKSASKD